MIKTIQGNILESDTEAIVNTVNTVGVMGKGIALQFKELYAANFLLYEKACKNDEVNLGKMFVTEPNQLTNPKYIINFPTKAHWKQKSSYEIIDLGLVDLVRVIKEKSIQSISIPPLGCGNGGLDWNNVRPMIEKKLESLSNVEVILYEPVLNIEKVNAVNINPSLTQPRAMVLDLIKQYSILGYEATLLEVQKLAYFLQRFGEPLRLQYKKHTYGPFAYNLQHLLNYLDGSFIESNKKIPDAKPLDKIRVIEWKNDIIKNFIIKEYSKEQIDRLKTVYQLIEGFESPFGMELLSSVDYVMKYECERFEDTKEVILKIGDWNERKKKQFNEQSILIGQKRLLNFSLGLGY